MSSQVQKNIFAFCVITFEPIEVQTRLANQNYHLNLSCLKDIYSEVPNTSVTFFILLGDFFLPTWPSRLFIFGKSCHLHCCLLSKYQKIPTYLLLLGPTRLLISELLGPHAY